MGLLKCNSSERDEIIARCIEGCRTKQGKKFNQKTLTNIFAQLKSFGVDILGAEAYAKSKHMYHEVWGLIQ